MTAAKKQPMNASPICDTPHSVLRLQEQLTMHYLLKTFA
jgi:hypothetical protein